MLFRRDILNRIAAGQVTTALRRWRRPSVKAGGRLRTAVGELSIDAVDRVTIDQISESDAKKAGFASRAQALADLMKQRDGQLYRIRFHLAGPDPRIKLRQRTSMPAAEFSAIQSQLDRLDARAKQGPWTLKMLRLIAANESTPAGELAKLGGFKKEWLKLNVRKLKNLGLTESLQPGYRVSPRGKAYLKRFSR